MVFYVGPDDRNFIHLHRVRRFKTLEAAIVAMDAGEQARAS
jgi:hypothetical protein